MWQLQNKPPALHIQNSILRALTQTEESDASSFKSGSPEDSFDFCADQKTYCKLSLYITMITKCTTYFNITKLYVSPTRAYLCVRMILAINSQK
jgi:hypothetical protein